MSILGLFVVGLEVVVGSIFLFSAVSKSLHPEGTLSVLTFLRLPFKRFVLGLLIGYEVALGFALCAKWRINLVTGLAVFTLLLFTAVLLLMRRSGFDGNCGCLGEANGSLVAPELRNGALVLVLAGAMVLRGSFDGRLLDFRPLLAGGLLVVIIGRALLVEYRRRVQLIRNWEG